MTKSPIETPVHLLLKYKSVSDQRKAQLGYPAILFEAFDDLDSLFGFWRELGWLEWSSRELYA